MAIENFGWLINLCIIDFEDDDLELDGIEEYEDVFGDDDEEEEYEDNGIDHSYDDDGQVDELADED
jgi:hypothetical protein